MDLLRLGFKSEGSLGRSRINDYFHKTFFQSDYWHVFGIDPFYARSLPCEESGMELFGRRF
jgi:oleate hydratase